MQTLSPVTVTFSDRVKIISANVNGYRTREPELKLFVSEYKHNSILALSDTRLKENIDVTLDGYNILRSDKNITATMATAGGVMLAIPEKWTCKKIAIRTSGQEFECIAAVILPAAQGSKPFKLMCVYNHPGSFIPSGLIDEFKQITFNGKNIAGFLVGDLNCAHPAFGSRTQNPPGNNLLQLLNNENLIFYPLQSPTYISNATGLPNTLDLVICDQSGSRLIENCYVGTDFGSDHLPVITELTFCTAKSAGTKVNFNKWVNAVDTKLENYVMLVDIDESIADLNRIISECKQNSTKKFSQSKRRLPPEVRQNIILRKSIMKNRKAATTDVARILLSKSYNRINKKIQHQMQEIKEKEAMSLAESICNANDTTSMWKSLKKYKNKNKVCDEPEAPLVTPSGLLTENNEDRCTEFARYLHSVHQTPTSPIFDEEFKKEIDEIIRKENREIGTNHIPSITVSKFQDLLGETKSNSAPGEDEITYELLKRCSTHSKKVFCNLLNKCLDKNVFPNAWKHAKVKMLAKPGRDKSQACNYRPISLLSCLGKMYERYIYVYLINELNEKEYLNDLQAGFRKRRSAHEHIFRLVQDAENGFKARKCTLALFLDVRAAFDAVWRNGLKYKINKIGLSKQTENILHSFLDNRTLNVFLDGVWSETVELKAGTPQGSVLSPILYLIYVNDLTTNLNLSRICASQYADDAGLWTTKSSVVEAMEIMQSELNELQKWCKKWYVSLHPAKSKLLLITKCPRHKQEIPGGPTLSLFNEQINIVSQADYLGVLIDSRLTWEPYVQKIVAKAYKRINLLRTIASLTEKHNPKIINMLYKGIIRSIFEYGSICTVNMADTHVQKLQLVQNQALRIMLQTPAYVSVKDLHDCSGLPLIKDHLIEHTRKRIKTMERLSPILTATISTYEKIKHIKENASTLDVIGYQRRQQH